MEKKSSKIILYYLLGAVAASMFIILGNVLDSHFGFTNICLTLAKLIVIEICILIIRSRDLKYKIGFNLKKFFTPYLLLGLIPILISFFMYYGPLNKPFDSSIIILELLSIVTTVLWEEMYFRGIGIFVFQDQPVKKTILLITFAFALSHLSYIFIKGTFETIVFDSILSLALGYFLVVVYLKTNNMLVPMTIHFLAHISQDIFPLITTRVLDMSNPYYYLLYIAEIIILFLVGTIMLKKRSS